MCWTDSDIAVALKGGAWREASMALLYRALWAGSDASVIKEQGRYGRSTSRIHVIPSRRLGKIRSFGTGRAPTASGAMTHAHKVTSTDAEAEAEEVELTVL